MFPVESVIPVCGGKLSAKICNCFIQLISASGVQLACDCNKPLCLCLCVANVSLLYELHSKFQSLESYQQD